METIKKKKSNPVLLVLVIIIIIGAIAAIVFLKPFFNQNTNSITVITESTLNEVLDIDELTTMKYYHNDIVPIYKDGAKKEEKNIKYRVLYHGTVTAGINPSDIDISIDESNKKIIIALPKVEIQDYTIDMGNSDYIFSNDKYDTMDTPTEAYVACLKDIKSQVKLEGDFLEMAKENTISTVNGICEPFLKQSDKEYQLEVNFKDE